MTLQYHLIQRRSWCPNWEERGTIFWGMDSLNSPDDPWRCVPVAVFKDRQRAETYKVQLERAARRHCSPFWFRLDIEDLSSMEENDLCSSIAKLGLTPPKIEKADKRKFRDWQRWWKCSATEMSEDQLQTIWDWLDKVRFYEIVEIELE